MVQPDSINYEDYTLYPGFYKLRTEARILFCVIQKMGHRFTSSELFPEMKPLTGVKHPGNLGLEMKTFKELGFIETDSSGSRNVYAKTAQFYNLMGGRAV